MTRSTFLTDYRVTALASLITVFVAGCLLAIVTEGFTLAGRRLLWITCVHDVVGTVALLPAAVALLAAVVTLAVFVAGVILIAVLVVGVIALLLAGS